MITLEIYVYFHVPQMRLIRSRASTQCGGNGVLDGRSNAYVEAMNGLLQQTKIAARSFRNIGNSITIAYLRMSRLNHLPANPMLTALPRSVRHVHFC